jgi:hypothetical protein
MQVAPTLDIAFIGLPGLFIGLVLGYLIGGMKSLRIIDRFGLGLAISGVGGLILSLLMSFFIEISPLSMLLVVLAFGGGYILGLSLNWKSPFKPSPKHHIIYEPDDDDAFDREIEEALGGNRD